MTALLQQAYALQQQGRLADAQRLYDQFLRAEPRHAQALQLAGICAMQAGAPARAEPLLRKAARLAPDDAVLLINLAACCTALGRHGDALAAAEQALALDPSLPQAHANRGNALRRLGRAAEALVAMDRAIALRPGLAQAHSNRGGVLHDLGRLEEALLAFDGALALQPDLAEAQLNRGQALRLLGRIDEALASLDRAIALNPRDAEAHAARGLALHAQGRWPDALTALDAALRINPRHAEALRHLGATLSALGRPAEALSAIDRAIALEPKALAGHYIRANALLELGRLPDAIAACRRVLALQPGHHFIRGRIAHVMLRMARWDGLAEEFDGVIQDIQAGIPAAPPLDLMGITTDRLLLRQGMEAFTTALAPPPPLAAPPFQDALGPLRIGYFSSDLHNHAVAGLMAGVFEAHDRARVQVTAYSFGGVSAHAQRRRIIAGVDRFVDVTAEDPASIARRARADGTAIAVDLNGYTQGCRHAIFACRAAPLQVNYLGFPGTMGAHFMDYIIADATTIPAGAEDGYTEAVIRLPHCYQANDAAREIAAETPTRTALGLPEDAVVLCCHNNGWKITPEVFAIWLRVLRAVPRAVLWLLEDNAWVAGNLRRAATASGIDAGRLHFASRVPPAEYMARFRAAELFLDTLPYNGGATASDALRAGLPVVTRLGDAFAGRMAASLLGNLGLTELVTGSADEYEALIVALARDDGRRAMLRARLSEAASTAAVFDTARFTRKLEAAFLAMHERRLAGLAPTTMDIA